MIQIAFHLLLYVFLILAIYHGFMLLPVRAKRWRSLEVLQLLKEAELPPWLFRLLRLRLKIVEEKRQLLLGCGFLINAGVYEGTRRLLMCAALLVAGAGYASLKQPMFTLYVEPAYVMAGAVSVLIFLFFDKKILVQLKAKRAHRIVREIYVISHHLLYYNDSRMSLHAKLSLCAAQTRSIRTQFGLLLNEWYQGSEAAIAQFKTRLGTDEAHSFGETLNALRLNEHASYYELLKQRIQDYKEKMELVRDSRKEMVSYVLFVLAGLPILNTFRVFMYPWIAEGRRLFDAIN
ncbi:hypothetical protein [Paenibacillus aceris]|uniref:Type II secretion system protein GspF domain-containing protein n=1 Tax=Paenibacillus aceris TaxID=869555 RepID=A0ABS4I7F6_9BACL|nr:hypothetical protein [Paenibacillus aceris]MBP1966862.1 hypothetical protein [Paenibacillus aceris]NHW38933.1 hypothetical protein [Paenibacillus aceris]